MSIADCGLRIADSRRRLPGVAVALAAAMMLLLVSSPALGEEIRLHNNQRIYGLIDGLAGPNTLRVIDASGALRDVSIEEIVSITYRGRERRMIQSGTQEFRFIDGGILRAEVLGNQGDNLRLLTRTSILRAFPASRYVVATVGV